MIDTVIMDLDGPVLDGRLRHYQCYRDIVLEKGFVPMSLPQYWEMKRGRSDRRQQLAASGADSIYDDFLEMWLDRIESRPYLALDRLQGGVLAKLRAWRTAGVRLLMATMRRNQENLAWQLETLGLRPWFASIVAVGVDEAATAKAAGIAPHLRGRALERCLWVGDTEVDIDAARGLGVKMCAVSCGLRTAGYLASLKPNYLKNDLEAIDLGDLSQNDFRDKFGSGEIH